MEVVPAQPLLPAPGAQSSADAGVKAGESLFVSQPSTPTAAAGQQNAHEGSSTAPGEKKEGKKKKENPFKAAVHDEEEEKRQESIKKGQQEAVERMRATDPKLQNVETEEAPADWGSAERNKYKEAFVASLPGGNKAYEELKGRRKQAGAALTPLQLAVNNFITEQKEKSGEDPETENDSDGESDNKERERILREGAANTLDRKSIPNYVLKEYQTLFPLVKKLWTRPDATLKEDEEKVLQSANEKISEANKKAGRSSGDFRFPMDTIRNKIKLIVQAYNSWHKETDKTAKDPLSKQLAKETFLFAGDMALHHGIHWRYLASNDIKAALAQAIGNSEPEFRKYFLEMTPYQSKAMMDDKKKVQAIEELFKADVSAANAKDLVAKAKQSVDDANKQIAKQNEEYGLSEVDETISVEFAESMNAAVTARDADKFKEQIQWFWMYLQLMGLTFGQAPHPLLENTFPKANFEAHTARWLKLPSTGGEPAGASAQPQPDTDQVPEQDYLAMYRSRYVSTKADDRHNFTRFGQIVQVRKVGWGYRAIINAGTEEMFRLIVKSSSELGIESEKPKRLWEDHEEFRPYEDIKKVKIEHMETILDFTEIPWKTNVREDGVQLRRARKSAPDAPATVPVRPVGLWAVRMKQTSDHCPGQVMIWSHSDLVARAKKEQAEEYRSEFKSQRFRWDKHFEAMKNGSRNPANGKPLSDNEIRERPWLAPERTPQPELQPAQQTSSRSGDKKPDLPPLRQEPPTFEEL